MLFVLTTVKKEKTEEITTKIIEEKIAACSLIINLDKSKFWWQGKITEYEEDLIIFKTTEENSEKLFTRIKELHPYEVPFIGQIDLSKINPEYEKWIQESVE